MVHQIRAITASSGTGMAEALWLAYVELQKAHLKDLQLYGKDDRANSIVLFTDGVPSAVTMYLNNPANSNAYNVIKSSSSCTNKTITVEDSAHSMMAWLAIPGPPYSSSSGESVRTVPAGQHRPEQHAHRRLVGERTADRMRPVRTRQLPIPVAPTS